MLTRLKGITNVTVPVRMSRVKPDVAESDRKWLGPARGRALLILGDVSLDSLSPYLRIRVYCTVFVQVLLCDAPFVHGVPREVLPRCSPHSLEPSHYSKISSPAKAFNISNSVLGIKYRIRLQRFPWLPPPGIKYRVRL